MDTEVLADHLRAELARLVPGARRFLLGISGGADSVALFRIAVAAELDAHVAHFDHGLREDAAADALFVERLADAFGVPFHGGSAPVGEVAARVGGNVEATARALRYAYLSRAARDAGADAVVVAHTRDDQAETVLHQLLRGAAHARGMAPVRGRVVRPLLDVGRDDLRAYLAEVGQPFRADATNADTTRTRAWLRHQILPRLVERNPRATGALARHADVQRHVATFLGDEVRRRFGEGALSVERLSGAPVALQREAVGQLLRRHELAVEFATVERIRSRLHAPSPWRLDVTGDATVRIAYGRVDVVQRVSPGPGERLIAHTAELPAGAPTQVLEDGPVTLRTRRPGDTIRLPGGSRKLSDLLIDRKVPREERDALAVVARGSDVLWVEGVAAAAGVAEPPDPEDLAMAHALELAAAAATAGELPVGAVVLLDGDVEAEAHNESERRADPTAHAEMLALQRAAQTVGRHRLGDATLVVTLEPCPMCMGAVLQAHVGRVVFGATNRRDGALGGVIDLTAAPWKRTVEVRGGVRAQAASRLLTEFFAGRRG